MWDRERRREREHWAREDMVRTFDQRQQAYVAYYKSIRAMARLADQRAKDMKSEPLPEGWGDQALADALALAIFGSASVALLASDVYFALLQWGTETSLDEGTREKLRAKYFKAESELLRLIRLELAVPGADSDQFPV
ncbi:hypothetical protein GCM10023170_093890 [Phytohabitans houttuyneae]|uniref:Uncharacterized protein n=2 Tax=Phytohabitans houttuyneae TaxID=1076126 RepID=A0A6V8KNF8_9ACTN|nr:hypothetical protein Phou_078890 [Phytohabitans houttuyneae]